jgi:hypothetical protein
MLAPARLAVRLSLAGVLFWAAASELVFTDSTPKTDTIYSLWMQTPLRRFAWAGFQGMIGVWLLSGIGGRSAAAALVVLLSAFSGLIASEMLRDQPKPCGCMGAEFVLSHDPAAIRRSLAFALARNGLMMVGAGWLVVIVRPNGTKEPQPPDAEISKSASVASGR